MLYRLPESERVCSGICMFIEEYQIFMNGRDSIMCPREDFERLYKIMGIALSDRKETEHGN